MLHSGPTPAVVFSGLLVLCVQALTACESEGPPEGRKALDAAARRAVYDASDRWYDRAALWKPAGSSGPAFDLAPLLILETGATGDAAGPAEVRFEESSIEIHGRSYRRWTFVWGGDGAGLQGLRMTLDSEGFPAIYEILGDSSGARLIFVSSAVEQAASAAFGAPLTGRRFTVERSIDETPRVVVPGILEPGPAPLGPFVYLSAEARDVTSLICRCMPSLVEVIDTNTEYALVASGGEGPLWPVDREGKPADQVLRFPPEPLRGAE